MDKKRALELLKCLPLRTDISLGEDTLEALSIARAYLETGITIITYEEWKEFIRKEPLTIKSTKKVEGLTFVELDESSVGTLATSIIDKIMKAKPPALPADVERKMRRIVENYRDDVISTNERAPIKEQKILLDRVATQLLSLYPQMASEDFIKKHYDEFLGFYYNSPCSGCPEGHASFWKSIIESPEWKAWVASRPHYDIPECEELGIISKEHFADFIKFTIAHAKPALTEEELEEILPPQRLIPEQERTDTALYCEMVNNINGFNKARSLCKQAILKWQRGER